MTIMEAYNLLSKIVIILAGTAFFLALISVSISLYFSVLEEKRIMKEMKKEEEKIANNINSKNTGS